MIRLAIGCAATWVLLAAADAAPEKKTVNGITYHILRTAPDTIRILWKNAQGKQLNTIPDAARDLTQQGLKVDTIMNGGIFEPGGIPSGLLIQEGHELRSVNRKDGKGNFFLKPNGIFLISTQGAAVIQTDEYPLKNTTVRCAVQSGPLLLRNARIHPAFNAGSNSRLHRNGVGVDGKGMVVLARSDINSARLPNLHEFASLFLTLGCKDALFLDGVISQMRSGTELSKPSNQFGSLIAVVSR